MSHPRIPSARINIELYHGTAIDETEMPFDNFDFRGDFDGVWFTDNSGIAKEFGDNFGSEGKKLYLYTVLLKTARIAVINHPLFIELMGDYAVEDIRELIPLLKEKGFKGWKTIGSLGHKQYDDYCVFDLSIPQIKNIQEYTSIDHPA